MGERMITVMQVFSSLGHNPDPATSWSVGSQVASMYFRRHGRQPHKDNRRKTNGTGTHCFALYPEGEWRPVIEDVIRRTIEIDASQGDLFGE